MVPESIRGFGSSSPDLDSFGLEIPANAKPMITIQILKIAYHRNSLDPTGVQYILWTFPNEDWPDYCNYHRQYESGFVNRKLLAYTFVVSI